MEDKKTKRTRRSMTVHEEVWTRAYAAALSHSGSSLDSKSSADTALNTFKLKFESESPQSRMGTS